eukprot:1758680-Rhodomonas_salina.1
MTTFLQIEKFNGATQPGILYDFPWHRMGNAKYLLFLPFVIAAAAGYDDEDNWCFHMVMIAFLRYVQVCSLASFPAMRARKTLTRAR